jgi:D-alanyl-D-alanine carboxypeptidase
LKILVLTLASVASAFSFTSLGAAQAALDAPTVATRVEQWIRPYVDAGDFSGVVLIAQGDRVLAEKAYGEADIQRDVANRLETRFRIASLSKTFTAAAIELLIAQGKLTLKNPLSASVVCSRNAVAIQQ